MLQVLASIDPDNSNQDGIKELKKLLMKLRIFRNGAKNRYCSNWRMFSRAFC